MLSYEHACCRVKWTLLGWRLRVCVVSGGVEGEPVLWCVRVHVEDLLLTCSCVYARHPFSVPHFWPNHPKQTLHWVQTEACRCVVWGIQDLKWTINSPLKVSVIENYGVVLFKIFSNNRAFPYHMLIFIDDLTGHQPDTLVNYFVAMFQMKSLLP